MPATGNHVFQFGPFSLDADRRLVLKAGEVVPLTPKAFDTLLALVRNHFRVVEKDELLKLIWPDTIVEDRNLAVNISTLRKVLGESPDSHEYIVTLPGRGYRFVAPVRLANGQQTSEPIAAEPGQPQDTGRGNLLPASNRLLKWKHLLAVACVAAALVVGFGLGRMTRTRPAIRFSTITNFAGVEGQPALSPDGRSVAFVSDRGGQYDVFVSLIAGGSVVRVTNDPNIEARPRWSPDGTRLLFSRVNEWGRSDSWVIPALGGIARKLISDAADPNWSPDGRSIAYANLATGSIWICDASGRAPRPFTKPEPGARHFQPSFSRDGRLAFVRRISPGGPYGELAVADLSGQQRSLTDSAAYVGSPSWSPDGRFIYFASGRGGTVNIWKVRAGGGEPEQVTVGQGDDADLDVSADGRRIVFASYRVNINLEEIAFNGAGAATRKWLTNDPTHSELAPSYSPDGKQIVYFTNRRGAETEGVWIVDSDGSKPIPLVQDERLNIYPRWLGNGHSIVYASRATGTGASRLWYQPDLRQIPASGGTPRSVPFAVADPFGDVSRLGQLLYTGHKGVLEVFDPKTSQVQILKDVRGQYPRWRRDGLAFAALVYPKEKNDADAGVWIHDLKGARQQIFRGWATFFSWAGDDELLVLEGMPDLNARLWRVRRDGSTNIGTIRLIFSYWHNVLITRFDVHPDGRRIVSEGLDLHQADLSMIESVE